MFNTKEERVLIKHLNKIFNTNYRINPFDFTKSTDLIEATTMASAEFFDMAHYSTMLSEIDSNFDETLETFFPGTWMKLVAGENTGKPLFNKAINQISSANNTFFNLMVESERKCADIWRIVLLNGNEEVIKHFFGDSVKLVDQSVWNKVLDEQLYDVFSECEFKRNVYEAANEFVKALKLRITITEAVA